MEASAEKPRWRILLTLLSAPALLDFVDLMGERRRSFFERLQVLLPEKCEDATILHEDMRQASKIDLMIYIVT